jgi:hypothetical protein
VPEGRTFTADVRTRIEPAMAEGGPHRAMEVFMRGNVGDEVFESIGPSRSRRSAFRTGKGAQVRGPRAD